MKQAFIIITFLAVGLKSYCQKFYISPNIGGQLAELSYLKSKPKPGDFHIPHAQFVPTIGIGFYLNTGYFTHRLGLQYVAAGMNYKVIPEGYPKANGNQIISGTSIDHLLISYSLQKETKTSHFIGRTNAVFKYSLGLGLGLNESKSHYNYYSDTIRSQLGANSFFSGQEYTHKRNGVGLFIMPEVGFDLFNKKGKRFLSVDLFYYQGLRTMITYNVHYYYGDYILNTRKDGNVVIGSRGTVFGLKVGIPIRIVKQ